MKLSKDWYKSERAKLLFAILLNLAFLAVMLLCFEVRFEENDDLTVQKYLDGQTAEKTAFVVYINYFLALLLRGLYDLSGNVLPVFSIFQYVLLFVSFTALSYLLFKRLDPLAAAAGSLALLCFFGADSYLIMTYTKTAGISTVGGISMMFMAMEEKGGVKKWLPLTLGIVTTLFSLMLRDKEFLACAALMAALGLFGLISHARAAESHKLRAAFAYAAPFLLTIVLAAGLFAANEYIWNNSACYDYKVFNAARSRFVDYNVPGYEQMPEAYEARGVSEDELDMFMVNCFDRNTWTAETYEQLADARDQAVAKPSLGECLGIFLERCLSAFFIQRPVYGLLAVLVLWLCCGRRDWLSFITPGLAFAAFALVYIFLIHQGRYLVNRTDAGFFFALAVTLLWFIDPGKTRKEGILCTLLILLCLGWGYRQNRDYCYMYPGNILGDDSRDKAAVEALIADEHLFLAEVDGLNLTLYSPLETVPAGYADKLILMGDWCENHPKNNALLAEYGIAEPFEDIVNNDRVCLISADIETPMAYINKYFAPNARAELVEPLSGDTGLNIYRVLD